MKITNAHYDLFFLPSADSHMVQEICETARCYYYFFHRHFYFLFSFIFYTSDFYCAGLLLFFLLFSICPQHGELCVAALVSVFSAYEKDFTCSWEQKGDNK